MATRVNQAGLPSADTDARVNRPSPPYSFIPSPSLTPLPPSPTPQPQHHRKMFLGDDLDTPANTSLAPSPVPQSIHFNGDESDNMRVDSDDDARDADADGDADIDADGDSVEEPDQVPVNYANASSSRPIARQVRGSGQVLAFEFTAYLYVQVIQDEDYVCFSLCSRSLFTLTHLAKGYEGTPDEDEDDDGSYGDEEYDAGGSSSGRRLPKKKKVPSKPKGTSIRTSRPFIFQVRILVASRQASSDSDSEYGARSKKKKKPRVSGDELRSSTRGVKVPNYADDVEDFEQFDEPYPGYYIDPNAQEKENDEIEAVLGHTRDEGHEDDPEDLWYENLVSPLSFRSQLV
jgi:chromodomain-helicase-DNA-binding protein 1